MKQCPKCKGKNIDVGRVRTAGLIMQSAHDPTIYYESNQKKFLAQKSPIYAYTCLDCGYVEHYIHPEHIEKRLRK